MAYKKNIVILLPDGVGLKNFVFSSIPSELIKKNFNFSYWNATPFNFEQTNYHHIPLNGKPSPISDIYKRVRKRVEISKFIEHTSNISYQSYLFKPSSNTLKQLVKSSFVSILEFRFRDNLNKLRERLKQSERKTDYFNKCLYQLKNNPSKLLIVSNQRAINAVAPVEAAKKLNIPTVSLIFSWDNLPKATMVVETDYYLVWSHHMKEELLAYYPYINENEIFTAGTPQFEIHYDENYLMSKDSFFSKYNLDLSTEYICFSGDDITTSPHDQIYLRNVAEAVKKINDQSLYQKKLGIIFRPCPVDFSNRFDKVLFDHNSEIKLIRPEWKTYGDSWNKVMPSQEDQILLANTVKHTQMVINVGSSMVFDYVAQNKPCAYINYNPEVQELKKDIYKIYQYIHFESMPNKDVVIWINDKHEIADKILEGLNNPQPYVENAQGWFKKINQHPPEKASERIVETINEIIDAQ